MLFTRWEVHIGKNYVLYLGYHQAIGLGRYIRQRAQFFPNMDQPWMVNNIFISF